MEPLTKEQVERCRENLTYILRGLGLDPLAINLLCDLALSAITAKDTIAALEAKLSDLYAKHTQTDLDRLNAEAKAAAWKRFAEALQTVDNVALCEAAEAALKTMGEIQ